MQDRQPSFVTDDNDDEDLCAEEKARKEEARGVSSKSRGSLLHAILYQNLSWRRWISLKMELRVKNLPRGCREAEASMSVFESRPEMEK